MLAHFVLAFLPTPQRRHGPTRGQSLVAENRVTISGASFHVFPPLLILEATVTLCTYDLINILHSARPLAVRSCEFWRIESDGRRNELEVAGESGVADSTYSRRLRVLRARQQYPRTRPQIQLTPGGSPTAVVVLASFVLDSALSAMRRLVLKSLRSEMHAAFLVARGRVVDLDIVAGRADKSLRGR